MRRSEIMVKVDLGLGRGRDRVLTCDLTKDYIAINAGYRS
jgi:glutamate N-acetyltransferase / amino-acid N-acetyltransferase